MAKKSRKFQDLGALQDLLVRACPPDKNGIQSVPLLAEKLGITSQSLYYWIKQDRIEPNWAKRITELEGCSVTLEEFYPFVFR